MPPRARLSVAQTRFLSSLRRARTWRDVLDGIRAGLGRVPIGFALPSAERLADQMGVTAPTVYRAIRELAAYNLLSMARGRRATVLSHTRSRVDGHLRGERKVMRVLSAEYRFAGRAEPHLDEARTALRLAEGDAIVVFDRVRQFAPELGEEGAPPATRWDRAYMPARLVSGDALAARFEDPTTSLKTIQRETLGLTPVVRDFTIVPSLATMEERRRLGLEDVTIPIVRVMQTSAAKLGGALVYYEFLITVASGWKLAYRWVREPGDFDDLPVSPAPSAVARIRRKGRAVGGRNR
jgi:DNA-binding GntR family transcriptional regulator